MHAWLRSLQAGIVSIQVYVFKFCFSGLHLKNLIWQYWVLMLYIIIACAMCNLLKDGVPQGSDIATTWRDFRSVEKCVLYCCVNHFLSIAMTLLKIITIAVLIILFSLQRLCWRFTRKHFFLLWLTLRFEINFDHGILSQYSDIFDYLQTSFKDLEIEDMYQEYCLQMRRSLVVVLLVIVTCILVSLLILHLAENKVILVQCCTVDLIWFELFKCLCYVNVCVM